MSILKILLFVTCLTVTLHKVVCTTGSVFYWFKSCKVKTGENCLSQNTRRQVMAMMMMIITKLLMKSNSCTAS